MNILFVMGSSYCMRDANSNLALIIMQNLKEHGHNIIVTGKTDNSSISLSEEVDGIYFERFYFTFDQEFYELKKQYIDCSKGYKEYFLSILKHPKIIFKFLERYYDKRSNIVYLYKKKIEKLSNKYDVDVVVSVTNPFFTAVAMAKAKVKCKKVIYQLDPHANVQFQMNKMTVRRYEEKLVYKVCNKILITDLLYKENKQKGKYEFLQKMEVINFPNIKHNTVSSESKEILYDSKYINCAFVGFFYNNIRNPHYLLEMFSKFENQKIRLNIIGGGTEDILNSYKNVLNERLCLYSRVSIAAAMNAMKSADILINVGNLIDNQMPSKILDYISTGKPIINIYKIENCPTLKYTKNYPYALNILETDDVSSENTKAVEKFCVDYKGKSINYEVIKKSYEEYTIENVASKFENILEHL